MAWLPFQKNFQKNYVPKKLYKGPLGPRAKNHHFVPRFQLLNIRLSSNFEHWLHQKNTWTPATCCRVWNLQHSIYLRAYISHFLWNSFISGNLNLSILKSVSLSTFLSLSLSLFALKSINWVFEELWFSLTM